MKIPGKVAQNVRNGVLEHFKTFLVAPSVGLRITPLPHYAPKPLSHLASNQNSEGIAPNWFGYISIYFLREFSKFRSLHFFKVNITLLGVLRDYGNKTEFWILDW